MSTTSDKAPETLDMTPDERHVWCYVFLRASLSQLAAVGREADYAECLATRAIGRLRERGMVSDAARVISLRVVDTTSRGIDVRYEHGAE